MIHFKCSFKIVVVLHSYDFHPYIGFNVVNVNRKWVSKQFDFFPVYAVVNFQLRINEIKIFKISRG